MLETWRLAASAESARIEAPRGVGRGCQQCTTEYGIVMCEKLLDVPSVKID